VAVGAMYPGTFDPITNGHYELVRRAAAMYDRLVVAVAASPNKTPVFSIEERMGLAREVLADLRNVTVDGYRGLTVQYARAHEDKLPSDLDEVAGLYLGNTNPLIDPVSRQRFIYLGAGRKWGDDPDVVLALAVGAVADPHRP